MQFIILKEGDKVIDNKGNARYIKRIKGDVYYCVNLFQTTESPFHRNLLRPC